jgi:hypothetical protein
VTLQEQQKASEAQGRRKAVSRKQKKKARKTEVAYLSQKKDYVALTIIFTSITDMCACMYSKLSGLN